MLLGSACPLRALKLKEFQVNCLEPFGANQPARGLPEGFEDRVLVKAIVRIGLEEKWKAGLANPQP